MVHFCDVHKCPSRKVLIEMGDLCVSWSDCGILAYDTTRDKMWMSDGKVWHSLMRTVRTMELTTCDYVNGIAKTLVTRC